MDNLFYFFLLSIRVLYALQLEEKNGKVEKRNVIFFPENLPSKKQEIPLPLIRRINEMDSNDINDFIEDFVELGPHNSTLEITSRISLGGIERSAIKSAKMAKCMPELQTVPLVPNSDSAVFYYPSCVRIERCGGCCLHRALSCQPVESEIVQFSVVKTEYRGGNQLKFGNKEVVGVEQHKKCKCDCKIQPEHCSKFQKYNHEWCRCECQNTDDKRKCFDEKRTKLWNEDLCTCTCREALECESGFYFDPFHCRCEAIRGRRRNTKPKPWSFDFKREYYNSEVKDIFQSADFKLSASRLVAKTKVRKLSVPAESSTAKDMSSVKDFPSSFMAWQECIRFDTKKTWRSKI